MGVDVRARVAEYYDLDPNVPDDIPFYRERIPGAGSSVLELGCGTGRVLAALAGHCRHVCGVDASPAMLDRCRKRLKEARVPFGRTAVVRADVTAFELGRTFDLIIAPYVLHALDTDAEVDGFFACARRHLGADATFVLNAPMPTGDPDALRRDWPSDDAVLRWEVRAGSERVTCHEKRSRMDPDRLVFYPELIYRRFQDEVLVDESAFTTVMRLYAPEYFERLVVQHGFRVVERWGGFAGEPYGLGPELVLQLAKSR